MWSGIPISQNFPVYCDHTVKGLGIVNKAEIDVFLELSCFIYDPADHKVSSIIPIIPLTRGNFSYIGILGDTVVGFQFSQFSLVTQSCLTLCDPMNCSTPGLSVWSLPKFMSIESVMPFNHFILCCPILLLPSIFPSIRVFANESALCTSLIKRLFSSSAYLHI